VIKLVCFHSPIPGPLVENEISCRHSQTKILSTLLLTIGIQFSNIGVKR